MEEKENEKQKKKRLPRHKRAKPEETPALKLTERDLEILKLVYDYRLLYTHQIQALTEGSNQVVARRLQKLFHNGYIDRPEAKLYETHVYALGNKGADELTLHFDIDRGKINWTTKNREAKGYYMLHALMISNFRATLTLALKDEAGIENFEWIPEGDATTAEVFFNEDGVKKRVPLVPDSFLYFTHNGRENNFFLEADRSTMTNQRFLNKMKAYWHYYKQGRHIKDGIGNFRVLTITLTEERKENLRRITKEADEQKKGSGMFWFTSEEKFKMNDPNSVLDPIWQTASNDDYHSLLE